MLLIKINIETKKGIVQRMSCNGGFHLKDKAILSPTARAAIVVANFGANPHCLTQDRGT